MAQLTEQDLKEFEVLLYGGDASDVPEHIASLLFDAVPRLIEEVRRLRLLADGRPGDRP